MIGALLVFYNKKIPKNLNNALFLFGVIIILASSMIFNEGFIDTELFWLSFGDLITYTVISTVIIAEIGFVTWLLLRWLRGNMKFNWSPVFHIGESARRRVDSSIEKHKVTRMLDNLPPKDMGPVEVGIDKKIVLNRMADESSVKMDEVKKGKVKTQKDKLKKLRGK